MCRKKSYPKPHNCTAKSYKEWRELVAAPFLVFFVGFVVSVILSLLKPSSIEGAMTLNGLISGVFFLAVGITIVVMIQAGSCQIKHNILPVKSKVLLGVSNAIGEGVFNDEVEAANWYRQTAEQGDATAQSHLASCYYSGNGVLKNEIEAYKWYLLAGSRGNEQAKKGIRRIEKKLSPEQRAEGQRLAEVWQSRFEMM
jgi:hypothetical protein